MLWLITRTTTEDCFEIFDSGRVVAYDTQRHDKPLKEFIMQPLTPKDILTESEASEYTGFSRNLFARARMTGRTKSDTPGPPYLKIGKHIRYRREDLDAWLLAHRVER